MTQSALVDVFVEEARDWTSRLVSSSVRLETEADPATRAALLAEILRDLHTMKGAAGSVDLQITKAIANRVHQLEDQLKSAGDPGGDLTDHLIEEVGWLRDAVERAADGEIEIESLAEPTAPESTPPLPETVSPVEGVFIFVQDEAPPTSPPRPPPELAQTRTPVRKSEMLKIRPERIDAAHQVAGELVVSRLQTEALTADLASLRELSAHTVRLWQGLAGQLRQSRRSLGAAWPIVEQKLQSVQTHLNDIRQETTGLARRATSVRDRSAGLIGALDQRIRDLRMMPVHPFLEELLPVAREASKIAHRRVRLEPDGGDAEVDRQVLSLLREPLLHLVRNAVVHGIEDERGRTAAGKHPVGTIRVRARCSGPTMRVEVIDDGRGIDARVVVARAREKGLAISEGADERDSVLRALTMQGVSTAAKVDGLAGRGVGLNVVADAVNRLDGELSVDWIPGEGTTFVVEVPIRSSTTAGLVVSVGNLRVGLPLTQIQYVVRLTRDDLCAGETHPFVRINGEPVAVTALGPFVGQPFAGLGPEKCPALVVRTLQQRVTLLVDDIVGQREMLIKGLPPAFARHPLLVGGAVEADGSVLQVLDVGALVQRVQAEGVARIEILEEAERPEVLVIDPSGPMQSLVGTMLRTEGFEVTPVTTLPQLARALRDPAFRLVVLDPRFEGVDSRLFSEELASLPDPPTMIWMSFDGSLRHDALQAGVRHFIDKSEFDQDEFLAIARGQLENP